MKKILLTLVSVAVLFNTLHSQNGLTNYAMPTGYTSSQLRYRNTLAIDNTNNKWIAFKSIGVGKFDGTNWTMFDTTNSGLPSMYTTALAVDAGNAIWIDTDRGLAKYNGSSWTVYNKINSGIVSDSITAITINGTTVYAGTYRGVSVMSGSSWTTYSKANSGIASDTIQAILVEPSGTIWFGTPKGLSRLSGSTWTTFKNSNSGLISNNILCLYYDGSNLWMGTNGGGIHQYSGGYITPLNSLNPLPPFQYPTIIYSITKGFQGGICFDWGDGMKLAEFIPSPAQTKFYFIPTSQDFFQTGAAGLIWFLSRVGFSSSQNNLFSFDFSNYVAPTGCNVVTPDNLKMLDINEVNAAILNNGNLHWNPTNNNHGLYEVPKGSGITPIYVSAIWIGGLDATNQLHGAGMQYAQGCDFFPGPINASNPSAFDKIWKVNRYKVEEFKYEWVHGNVQNGTYTPDQSILTWPAIADASYAPFVDVNHNGIYDPLTGGDYPKIKGDQCLYFIMNDIGTHSQTQCTQMGIEIHASAYAYTCPLIADSEKVINYTTLYHYEIINRSSLQYDSVYIANWQDGDLGCATDDHVGCYPKGNYSYYYNEDSIDVSCGSELGYGADPPILSTVILNGPLAKPNDGIDNNNNGVIDEPGEKNLMTHFFYFTNLGSADPHSDPIICKEYYNYLSGSWKDGSPLVYGGSGWAGSPGATTTPTAFCYPGFPYDASGWHDPFPGNSAQDDRRDMTSCGPFTMLPGAVDTFDFAVVYTRDTTLPFMGQAIFDKNMHDNQRIQRWFATNSFPSCLQLNAGVNEENQNANAFTIYPNPTSGAFQIQ